MNAYIKSILNQEANRYKTNFDKHHILEQKYKSAKEALETAKDKREKVIVEFALGNQDPAKVKETITLYDRIIIPNLKKSVKNADNLRMKTSGYYSIPDVMFLVSAAMYTIIILKLFSGNGGYSTIICEMVLIVSMVIICFVWIGYRRMLNKMAFKQ